MVYLAIYFLFKKDELLKSLNDKLSDFDVRMAEMQKKADEMEESGKEKLKLRLTGLQEKRKNVKTRIDELNSASGDALKKLRDVLDVAWEDLETAFEEATQTVGNK